MRRPPYITLERPNHLRDIWDKWRILLLQLRIFPKIIPLPSIQIQPPSEIEGLFLDLSQQTKKSLRKYSAPPKGCIECSKTPPKRPREC
jgi:hypothetical protein